MKKVLLLFGLLVLVIAGIILSHNFLNTDGLLNINNSNPEVIISNQTFKLKLAKTPKEQEIGLSETTSLPQNQGMLFVFESPGNYSFWMKNMQIPIDIIYINDDEITQIFEDVQPPANPNADLVIYSPQKASDKVLEINAGLSKKHNFKTGDKVEFKNI